METKEWPFMRIMAGMHHAFGLNRDYWPYTIFGAFNLGVSVAFLILGATGIHLWFKIHAERRIGAVILLSSLGLTLLPVVLIRVA